MNAERHGLFIPKYRRYLNKTYGAEGRTRTGTTCVTAPSRQRVYQFHHFGNSELCYCVFEGDSFSNPGISSVGEAGGLVLGICAAGSVETGTVGTETSARSA